MNINIFTTNENTTDGEILDRIYQDINREGFSAEMKLHFITLTLEYAREDNQKEGN